MNLPVSEFSHLEKEDHPISSSLQQQQESSTNNHQTASMGLLLSEEDKLLILLAAFLLVVATVVVTSCLVLPRCYLYQRFLKPKQLISGLGLALGKLNEKAAAAADEGSNSKSTSKSSKGQCQLNASIVYPFFNSSGQQGGGKNAASSESDHFHLSIVPVYGLQPQTRSLASSPVKHPSLSSSSSNGNSSSGNGTVAIGNQYENLTQLAEKTRLRYSSLKPDNLKALPCFPKVRARLRVELLEEPASSASAFRLHVTVDQVTDLKLKEYLCEPSVYVTGTLVAGAAAAAAASRPLHCAAASSAARRLILHELPTQSELFRTETIKRSLNPVFGKTVRSELLPRSLLKEGCLKLRVMDEERYANDVCLGEVAIALRKISPLGKGEECWEAVSAPEKMKKKDSTDSKVECENGESSSTSAVPQIRVNGAEKSFDEELVVAEAGEQPGSQISTYTLFPIKEVKGDIFVGFCFLPTSKRINVTVVKANVRPGIVPANSTSATSTTTTTTTTPSPAVHHAFYARILQFNNGRLVKKKKTGLSVRLSWGEHETVSFDLIGNSDSGTGSSTVVSACEPLHLMSFMLVLCCKAQNSTTPSSTEGSPQEQSTPEQDQQVGGSGSRKGSSGGSSRKDRIVGHFVLDHHLWMEEILRKPRKQIIKWHDLF
ncbi:hypothetical protein TYRP_002907 [Tyrophagus putrescentiae]|nr:hypothetical protein TYRP_002907 [Tyrophagus putrescentiae]